MQTRAEREIEPADLAFIRDSIAADDKRRAEEAEQERKREAAEREEQERRVRDAERIAEEQTKAAAAQKRFTLAAVVGLIIALVLAALAGWQYFDANQAKQEAYKQRDKAEQATKVAYEATTEAENERKRPRPALIGPRPICARRRSHDRDCSLFMAHQARTGRNAGAAVLLALEALPDDAAGIDRPYVPEAELQLDGALRDLRERLVLGHAGPVSSAAFSPDGKRIVTASWDKTARIWDAATGKPIGDPLTGHDGVVMSAAFSPDGKRIVTASEDKTARIWDAATGKPIGDPLTGHEDAVISAAFSPDGKRIVTASGQDGADLGRRDRQADRRAAQRP